MPRSGEDSSPKHEIQKAHIFAAQRRCHTNGARFILGREECECKHASLWMLGQFARASTPIGMQGAHGADEESLTGSCFVDPWVNELLVWLRD